VPPISRVSDESARKNFEKTATLLSPGMPTPSSVTEREQPSRSARAGAPDDASERGVLDRIREQIAHYLGDPLALTQDRHGFVRKLDLQLVLIALG